MMDNHWDTPFLYPEPFPQKIVSSCMTMCLPRNHTKAGMSSDLQLMQQEEDADVVDDANRRPLEMPGAIHHQSCLHHANASRCKLHVLHFDAPHQTTYHNRISLHLLQALYDTFRPQVEPTAQHCTKQQNPTWPSPQKLQKL